ncbi:MAG: hypothetical protein WEE50_02250, partial [Chloroflexota bacterium]
PMSTLERMDAEFHLLIARRRVEQCAQGGPSWDAAMGLVDELEADLRRIDRAARTLLAVCAPSR